MQHDLLALMQQDAEHRSDKENRDVAGLGAGLGLEHDLAPAAQQKARDARNAKQEPVAGDLPGGAPLGGVFQDGGHRRGAHRDGGSARLARWNGAGQFDLACDHQPGDTV